jgi:2-polyprenyl-3-methyl-5-hydroxy-6-metoxy-1,4-benzoquinol methylase
MDNKKRAKYNIQPYDGKGDTCGKRTRVWYVEQVFCRLWHYFVLPRTKRILDVGCGNGRMNGILHEANPHAKVVCIDPVKQCHPRFFRHGEQFRQIGLESVKDGPYDIITFWASALIIFKSQGAKRVLRRLRALCHHKTFVIILQAQNNFRDYLPEILKWFKVKEMFTTKDGSSICIILQGWKPND